MKKTSFCLKRFGKFIFKACHINSSKIFSIFVMLILAACSKYSGSVDEQLFQAIGNVDQKAVTLLLKQGADPNFVNESQIDMLEVAYYTNHLEIYKLLIESGAIFDSVDPDLRVTPLSQATNDNKIEFVKLLLEKGANVNNVNTVRLKTTALMLAARENHTEILNLLIENGAKLETIDSMRDTALGYAVAFGNYEAAIMLIEAGADYTVIGQGTNTLLDWAHFSGNNKLIDYIEGLGVKSASHYMIH